MHNNMNVNVSGPVQPTSTYKTVVLKGQVPFASQVTEPNMKYVIKHNFDLGGGSVTIPEGCLLEFDGGAISNGTLVGQSTILIYNQPLSDILTATLEGTWRHESGVKADEEDITDLNGELKLKDRGTTDGMGKIILRKNKTFAEQLTQENTIYVIQYDFTLGDDITVPENCVLEFDGGSILGKHTINYNKCYVCGDVKIYANTYNEAANPSSIYIDDFKLSNDVVYVDWFGTYGDGEHDDSNAILNAIHATKLNGAKLVFGNKTYLHGDGLQTPNGTGNDWNQQMSTTNVGRDIRLQFYKYQNLEVDGNGCTILSNPNNGECRNNAIFTFISCDKIYFHDVNINGNRTQRGASEDDYSTGGHNYSNGVDTTYNTNCSGDRSNIDFSYCNDIRIENVTSEDSMMDCLYVSGDMNRRRTSNCIIRNCNFGYSYRQCITIGDITNCVVNNTNIYYAAYNKTPISNGINPKAGIDIEAGYENCVNVSISNCDFNKAPVIIYKNANNVSINNCSFNNSDVQCSGEGIRTSKHIILVTGCLFNNSVTLMNANGFVVKNNSFLFDLNRKYVVFDNQEWGTSISDDYMPWIFEDNYVEANLTGTINENWRIGAFRLEYNGIFRNNKIKNVYAPSVYLKRLDLRCHHIYNNIFINDTETFPALVGQELHLRYYGNILSYIAGNKIEGTWALTDITSRGNEHYLRRNGTSANRPTIAYVGYCYFDTTLGKPIFVKTVSETEGVTEWVDATGATV